MAIHLSREDGTASGLWHEIARADLKIIFKIKNRQAHVTLWFVFWFSLGILFYF